MIYNQIYPGGYVREFKYLNTDGDLKEKQSPSVYRRKNMEIFILFIQRLEVIWKYLCEWSQARSRQEKPVWMLSSILPVFLSTAGWDIKYIYEHLTHTNYHAISI